MIHASQSSSPSAVRALALFAGLSLFLIVNACADDGRRQAQQATRHFVADSTATFAEPELRTDLRRVGQFRLAAQGILLERYQQFFGEAAVLGGQLTVQRDADGTVLTTVGAHYSDIVPRNRVRLSEAEALQLVTAELDAPERQEVQLSLDPSDGRLFYLIDSVGRDYRWQHRVDAQSGEVYDRLDALTSGCGWNGGNPGGVGFLSSSDYVDLTGLVTGDALSTSRITTRDLGSQKKPFYGTADKDADLCWDAGGRASPGQGALVSAHSYAELTDTYFGTVQGFDWVGNALSATNGSVGEILVWAHYDVNYVNAFWNGSRVVFGDGDGSDYREMTALDIVAHELTHAVTDFTSDLIYRDESGALNEAFSDIMGRAVGEWSGLDTNWTLGEDSALTGSGFRNMADPAAAGDPDHYSEAVYLGTSIDNGGVHYNSGIANQAFYLLAEGGSNAGEARGHNHSGPSVTGIGIAAAANIFFLGFASLPNDASFCDARAATQVYAGAHLGSVADAWRAVGLTDAVCPNAPLCSPVNACGGCATLSAAPGTACNNGSCDGSYVCDGADAVTCQAPALNACSACAPEPANAPGAACSEGVGECQASGSYVCDGSGDTSCDASAGTPSAEICDDGLDNDCDGATDASDSDCGAPSVDCSALDKTACQAEVECVWQGGRYAGCYPADSGGEDPVACTPGAGGPGASCSQNSDCASCNCKGNGLCK